MLESGFLSRDAYTAWKPQIQGSWNSTVGFWSFAAPYCWRTDAEAETAILWPPGANWLIWRLWSWQRLKAGEGEDDRGWDGWMASPTPWIWVWVSSGSWWWTGKPGVLWSTGLQRVRHDWATELNWAELLEDWIDRVLGLGLRDEICGQIYSVAMAWTDPVSCQFTLAPSGTDFPEPQLRFPDILSPGAQPISTVEVQTSLHPG